MLGQILVDRNLVYREEWLAEISVEGWNKKNQK